MCAGSIVSYFAPMTTVGTEIFDRSATGAPSTGWHRVTGRTSG